MSIIARVCLVLALALGAYSSFVLIKQVEEHKNKLTSDLADAKMDAKNTKEAKAKVEAELKAKADEVVKAQEETKKVVEQLTAATAKVTAQTADIEKLNKDMEELKKKPVVDDTAVNDLKTKLAAAEQARAATEAQVKEAADKLKAKTDEVAALDAEKKVLADTAKKQDSKIRFLEGREGWEMPLPADLTGKVLFYDKNWNFVVLDCGKKKGAVENGVMILHRSTDILGPVRLSTVDDDACIGDFMGDFKKKPPQPGDTAIPKK